jgi:hypothetical protein
MLRLCIIPAYLWGCASGCSLRQKSLALGGKFKSVCNFTLYVLPLSSFAISFSLSLSFSYTLPLSSFDDYCIRQQDLWHRPLFPYNEYWITIYAVIGGISSLTRSNTFSSRYMGTITGIGDIDSVRWPNSHWRSVKVYFWPVLLLFPLPTTSPCQPFELQTSVEKRYYSSTPLKFVLSEIPTLWFCMITKFTYEWI